MIRPASRQDRTGFTLMELLVVIAIIATLAGLLLAGVMVAYGRMNDARNASDINQMVVAMEAFKTQFKCYPPSRVRLRNYNSYSTTDPLDIESQKILLRMWPRLQLTPVGQAGTFDWSGTGNSAADTGNGWVLEGDQCLVFFLGGMPTANPNGVTGFDPSATNPTQPIKPGGNRISPFFAFQTSRLVLLPHGGLSSPFYSYNDVYGTPFAYFCTLEQQNQYNPYYSYPYGAQIGAAPISDCQSIGAMPYYAPSSSNGTVQYQNGTTYQIISAGVDMTFGSTTPAPTPPNGFGGVIYNAGQGIKFSLASGAAFPASFTNAGGKTIPYPGLDDRTNFNPNILAAGGAQ